MTFAIGRELIYTDLTVSTACVTPYTYGAKGDGVTDDTAAVNAAMAAVGAGTLCIPPGNFLITSMLTIPTDQTWNCQGGVFIAGYSGTIVDAPNGGFTVVGELHVSDPNSKNTSAGGPMVWLQGWNAQVDAIHTDYGILCVELDCTDSNVNFVFCNKTIGAGVGVVWIASYVGLSVGNITIYGSSAAGQVGIMDVGAEHWIGSVSVTSVAVGLNFGTSSYGGGQEANLIAVGYAYLQGSVSAAVFGVCTDIDIQSLDVGQGNVVVGQSSTVNPQAVTIGRVHASGMATSPFFILQNATYISIGTIVTGLQAYSGTLVLVSAHASSSVWIGPYTYSPYTPGTATLQIYNDNGDATNMDVWIRLELPNYNSTSGGNYGTNFVSVTAALRVRLNGQATQTVAATGDAPSNIGYLPGERVMTLVSGAYDHLWEFDWNLIARQIA